MAALARDAPAIGAAPTNSAHSGKQKADLARGYAAVLLFYFRIRTAAGAAPMATVSRAKAAMDGGRFVSNKFAGPIAVSPANLCKRFANIISLGIVRIDLQHPFKVLPS